MSSSVAIDVMNSERVSRIDARTIRPKQEYDRRLLQYERDFDIRHSRIAPRGKTLRESMLSYSERMRSISNARVVSDNSKPAGEHFVIRANHIPKYRQLPKIRRPLSLDELIGTYNKQDNKAKKKPKSAYKLSWPSLPEQPTKNRNKVKVSLFSASDFYNIVDYSLKHKTRRRNVLPLHQHPSDIEKELEAESKRKVMLEIRNAEPAAEEKRSSILRPLDTKERTKNREKVEAGKNEVKKGQALESVESLKIICSEGGIDKPLTTEHKMTIPCRDNPLKVLSDTHVKGIYITNSIDDSIIQPIKPDVLQKRPNRAKRMKLHEPQLGAIPEGDGLHSQTKRPEKEKSDWSNKSVKTIIVRRSLGKVADRPELEIILETKVPCPITNDLIDSESDVADVKDAIHNSSYKLDPLKTKTRAQKRLKKLIFLRDIPE